MLFDTAAAALDWLGVIVFAISGALVASRKQMDVVGFALLGTATGIGGGTLRDLLLGRGPVFWVREPAYLVVCVIVSGAVFFTAHIPQSRYRVLLWFDALGLALFAVTGAERALLAGSGPVVAVAMGVITATFGGVIRDVLGNESPVVLSREVYVTAALVGATVVRRALRLRLRPRERARRGPSGRARRARDGAATGLVPAALPGATGAHARRDQAPGLNGINVTGLWVRRPCQRRSKTASWRQAALVRVCSVMRRSSSRGLDGSGRWDVLPEDLDRLLAARHVLRIKPWTHPKRSAQPSSCAAEAVLDVEAHHRDLQGRDEGCCQRHPERPEQGAEHHHGHKRQHRRDIDGAALDHRGEHVAFHRLDQEMHAQRPQHHVRALRHGGKPEWHRPDHRPR